MPENPTSDVDLRRYVKMLLYRTTVVVGEKYRHQGNNFFLLILFFVFFFSTCTAQMNGSDAFLEFLRI